MEKNPGPIIRESEDQLAPPVSKVAWSPDIVAQSIEIIPIFHQGPTILWLKPVHASSLRIGWPVKRKPSDAVLKALRHYEIVPRVAHSTSWRQDEDRLILTYIAIVSTPGADANPNLVSETVSRATLARGEANEAPAVIEMGQVIEHGLRHLAWLLEDDPVVAAELRDWEPLLETYVPEPFRSFRAN